MKNLQTFLAQIILLLCVLDCDMKFGVMTQAGNLHRSSWSHHVFCLLPLMKCEQRACKATKPDLAKSFCDSCTVWRFSKTRCSSCPMFTLGLKDGYRKESVHFFKWREPYQPSLSTGFPRVFGRTQYIVFTLIKPFVILYSLQWTISLQLIRVFQKKHTPEPEEILLMGSEIWLPTRHL